MYKVEYLNKNCRVCKSSDLDVFLTLNNMPFTDDFVSKENIGKEFVNDINIYRCNACNTVQTQHNVAVDEYYEDYQYSVGASTFASTFMHNIAAKLMDTYFSSETNVKVLEVGSGDGEQLVPFKKLGCEVLGFEPSTTLIEVAAKKGISSVKGLFTEDSVDDLPNNFKEVDIVFLSYTFDHIPNPIGFLNAVKKILNKQRGILVIENHDLEKIFERKEYCLFEHEHSIYLTKKTAIGLADKNNLNVLEFDVLPENERRANSLIFVLSSENSKWANKKITSYNLSNYDRIGFYKEQANLIYRGISKFELFIEKNINSKRKIAGYGAGGRGIMTLAALKNANKLEYLIDKKPKAENIYSPSSHLEVTTIENLIKKPVDIIIVFSFGYIKEIKEDIMKMGYKEEQIISMLDILK
jgi:2-polyprenyl-3-methyl-5-hydroxy-6-metoxy-1,4-benzoquinol methylase